MRRAFTEVADVFAWLPHPRSKMSCLIDSMQRKADQAIASGAVSKFLFENHGLVSTFASEVASVGVQVSVVVDSYRRHAMLHQVFVSNSCDCFDDTP